METLQQRTRRGLWTLYVLALATAFHAPSAVAQATEVTVDLEEAIRLFRANNPALSLARSDVAGAAGRLEQSDAFPNPTIGGTHESLSGGGRELSESYVTLSQRLVWPGSLRARRNAAASSLGQARASYAADSASIEYEVRSAYIETASAAARYAAVAEVAAVFRDSRERAETRFADGDLSRYGLDRIGLERLRYERLLAASMAELDGARLVLGSLILPEEGTAVSAEGFPSGLPPRLTDAFGPGAANDSLVDDGGGADALDPEVRALLGEAVTSHPAVAAARADLDAARARVDVARSLRIPDPTLTGGYKTQSDDVSGVYLGISVPLPLLDRKGGEIRASEADVDGARSRLDLVTRSVERDLYRALLRYRTARAQAELLLVRDPPTGTPAPGGPAAGPGGDGGLLETARVAYQEGEMDLLELMDAAAAHRDGATLSAELLADAWITYYDLRRAAAGAFDPYADDGAAQ